MNQNTISLPTKARPTNSKPPKSSNAIDLKKQNNNNNNFRLGQSSSVLNIENNGPFFSISIDPRRLSKANQTLSVSFTQNNKDIKISDHQIPQFHWSKKLIFFYTHVHYTPCIFNTLCILIH